MRHIERDEHRKRAVSIRMSAADLQKIKKLARRLGARDSDVIRFAVKSMLTRLALLCDSEASGRGLVPVFVESGSDLLQYFDLDVARLNGILNDGVDEQSRVDYEDVQLLALSGLPQPYLRLKLNRLNEAAAAAHSVDGNGNGNGVAAESVEQPDQLAQSLRRYLYEKYLFGAAAG